jgi:hypothetical protein
MALVKATFYLGNKTLGSMDVNKDISNDELIELLYKYFRYR